MRILFYGAGMSYTSGVPAAGQLFELVKTDHLLEKYAAGNRDIWKLAQALEDHHDEKAVTRLKERIADALRLPSQNITPEYRMLAFLIKKQDIREVYTTNQDTILEQVLGSHEIPFNRYTYDSGRKVRNLGGYVDIIKLCGDIHDPEKMCFSKEELKKAADRKGNTPFGQLLSDFEGGESVTFIGYSFYPDAVGSALREAAANGKGEVNIVDSRPNDYQLEIGADSRHTLLVMGASVYLNDHIVKLRPEINCTSILFSKSGFGGVQTYYYSLKEICKNLVPIRFTERETQRFFERDAAKAGTDHSFGFTYLRATASAVAFEAMTDRSVDVLHAHDFITGGKAANQDMPCVYTSHSLESKEMEYGEDAGDIGLASKEEVEWYERTYYSDMPNVLALSESYIKELPKGTRHAVKRMRAPFLLDEFRGETQDDSLPVSVDEANFKKDVFTVAYFGRATKRKGLSAFVKALNMLCEKTSDFQALFVGPDIRLEGDDKLCITMEASSTGTSVQKTYEYKPQAAYKQNAFTMKLMVTEEFETHLHSLRHAYDLCDVVVIPSQYEPFGYVALEALAAQKLVIARKVGGLEEILADGRGILIDCADEDLFARAIMEKLVWAKDPKNRKERERISANGCYWVRNEYAKEKMKALAEEMYQLYLSAIFSYGRLHIGGKNEVISYDTLRNQLWEMVKGVNDWKTLLVVCAKEYRKMHRFLSVGGVCERVDFDLFWEIARWLKELKPLCPQVSKIPHKDLAELITQTEWVLP